MEDSSTEKIAKELIKAVQVLPWLGYAMFGVVALYIGAVWLTWTIQWIIHAWQKALVLLICGVLYLAYCYWKWDGK